MNKQISNRVLVVSFVAIMVVALAGYAVFVESAKEKTSLGSIGTIAIELVPNPASGGTETVKLTFEAPGEWDFSGYTIGNGNGFTHIIDADPVSSNGSILVCGTNATGYNCDDVWGAVGVFPDTNGTLVVEDPDGNVVLSHNYTDPGIGGSTGNSPDLVTTVYSQNAQITYCRNTKQGFTGHQAPVSSIIDGKGATAPEKGSIIPSFYYDMSPGVGYYAGMDWPDTTGTFANCI